MLEKMGVKVLRVETDYSEEDVEQLKIRLEAFLEVIKFSK
jgi:benzoyl-CoA reductase/2-hydroxyglutaryl-CoA dehydratase subunit BcrC/BadD/HgdB